MDRHPHREKNTKGQGIHPTLSNTRGKVPSVGHIHRVRKPKVCGSLQDVNTRERHTTQGGLHKCGAYTTRYILHRGDISEV